jgi:serine/threonine-protein kinase
MPSCPRCRTSYPDSVELCPSDGEPLLPSGVVTLEAELAPGTRVSEYTIEDKLGEGGFGSVYRAMQTVIGKPVAIKVLNRQYSSSPEMVSRFLAEARAVNQIRHRNIIDIFSFGRLDDGRQFYVMELLEGMTLDRYAAAKGPLAPEEAIPLLRGVARALDAAHAAGIAHRDLKPENVFLTHDEDGRAFPKLLDFGIAKLAPDAGQTHKTRTGTPLGTPLYMSPEQCRGRDVDTRTDVYSFGVLTHQLLTGQLPFEGESVMDVLLNHMSSPPPPMSSVRPDLAPALDAPVLHMLEKEAARRPRSLLAALDELARAAIDAGYALDPATTRTPELVVPPPSGAAPPRASTPRAGTPPLHGTLAEAKTALQGGHVATPSRGSERAPRRRMGVWIGVGLAALAGAAAVALALGDEAPAPPRPAAPARAETAAPAPLPSAPEVAPARAPEPPEPVEIVVQAVPAGVDIYRGDERLGAAPGPVRLARGDAKVTLTLRAAGYKPADVEVVPTANAVVAVTLQKPTVTKKPAALGEIEDPF